MQSQMNILDDLGVLTRQAISRYNSEFLFQDVILTDEFKELFTANVAKTGSSVQFYQYTAVVTSSKGKQTFIPNQWFVIAAFVVELCVSLKKYQSLFYSVCDYLHEIYEQYAKSLRGYFNPQEQARFIEAAIAVIQEKYDCNQSLAQSSAEKLWRFSTDYTWWTGQKTIDRGDFMYSTILANLNLVAANQGYVADIVYIYVNDDILRELVRNPEDFTQGLLLNKNNFTEDNFTVEDEIVPLEHKENIPSKDINRSSTMHNTINIKISKKSLENFTRKK